MRILKHFVRRALPVLAASVFVLPVSQAQESAPLNLKVYNASAGSFNANAVILSGKQEAMVIDTGFTRADALRIAADVLDTGKTLKTILISNADPDYYFGAEVLKEIFPQARVVSTPAVREKIQAKLAGKVAFWGPKMGPANAPRQPIVPEALTETTLRVDGEAVELRGTEGILAHRPYVWIPSIGAIAGNVAVLGNLHVWTADTQQLAERQAWVRQLDEMLALKPRLVVPGHMQAGTALDERNIRYTREYLVRYEQASARHKDSAGLIAEMKAAYPNAALGMALDIGAKVTTGEMKW